MQGMVQRRILGAVPIVVLVHRGTKASMPSSGGHAGLDGGGVQMSSTDDTERLKTTEQFDLALIDAMIPHHPTASRMTTGVQAEVKNQEMKDLAVARITTQKQEIAQMRDWRRQ